MRAPPDAATGRRAIEQKIITVVSDDDRHGVARLIGPISSQGPANSEIMSAAHWMSHSTRSTNKAERFIR